MKEFNTTGKCIPERHYMADISDKIEQITALIDTEKYFIINRARQYGKTTIFGMLEKQLKEKYIVFSISFEGSDVMFTSIEQFVKGFLFKISNEMQYMNHLTRDIVEFWNHAPSVNDFDTLGMHITKLCEQAEKKIILLVDEVDKSSNNQIFMSFLGMLRSKYLERDKRKSFHSVVLAGVYDIKNLKLKLRPDEEQKYNSPWNIAVDFNVDMRLKTNAIISMLKEYEADYHTGMDIAEVAGQIFEYTDGYPFLVSRICQMLDEGAACEWNCTGVRQIVKRLLNQNNTLFDDLIKNIENDKEYANLVEEVVFSTEPIPFRIAHPLIARGVMFGIFKEENGCVSISNKIFEMYIYEYFISVNRPIKVRHFDYVTDGQLNMENVLRMFQKTMRKMEGNVDDYEQFIESQGRLLLIAFLTPILNGTGHYVLESLAKDKTRMDVQVFYGSKEYVLELKIWHGEKQKAKAYQQLSEYLESRSLEEGYLINFSFLKNKNYKMEWIEFQGKRIFEINI